MACTLFLGVVTFHTILSQTVVERQRRREEFLWTARQMMIEVKSFVGGANQSGVVNSCHKNGRTESLYLRLLQSWLHTQFVGLCYCYLSIRDYSMSRIQLLSERPRHALDRLMEDNANYVCSDDSRRPHVLRLESEDKSWFLRELVTGCVYSLSHTALDLTI